MGQNKMATIMIVAILKKDSQNNIAFGERGGVRYLTGGLKRLGGFPEKTTQKSGDRDPVTD